jgi:hypothetical protein
MRRRNPHVLAVLGNSAARKLNPLRLQQRGRIRKVENRKLIARAVLQINPNSGSSCCYNPGTDGACFRHAAWAV